MIKCQTKEHMHWPGVRSCHRGWRTSAKSSCLHGGWWQEIWPLGSFASLLRYADNPGRKRGEKQKITRGTQVKHITLLFLPLMWGASSLNTREWTHVRKVHFKTWGATVGAGALHVKANHVSIKRALTFFFINIFDLICELTNEITVHSEGRNRNSRAINKLQGSL